MVTKYIPKKGDIIYINLNPQKGREQAGKRPALVLSPYEYNKKVGLSLLCPITKQIKGYPFEVILPKKFKINGAILADHIKNLDWQSRSAKFIEKAPPKIIEEVLNKVKLLISSK